MAINGIDILYHGTNQPHKRIILKYTKEYKDFGKGYYLTSNEEQAIRWAQRKGNDQCWVYQYRVKDIPDNINIVIDEYKYYDERWLNFITSNREGNKESFADIIYDRMADCVFQELSQLLHEYSIGKVSAGYVLKMIPFPEDIKWDQYCFKTKRAINLLERVSELHFQKTTKHWELIKDDVKV